MSKAYCIMSYRIVLYGIVLYCVVWCDVSWCDVISYHNLYEIWSNTIIHQHQEKLNERSLTCYWPLC